MMSTNSQTSSGTDEIRCARCGRPLTREEIGLHRKLVNRGATTFWCMDCLSEHFSLSTDQLHQIAEDFRKQGCLLFR